MRAAFVLALLLSVASPPMAWSAMADSSPKPGASVSLASTASAASQLVRDTAKAEKTFSGGWLTAPEAPAHHQEFEGSALGRPPDVAAAESVARLPAARPTPAASPPD